MALLKSCEWEQEVKIKVDLFKNNYHLIKVKSHAKNPKFNIYQMLDNFDLNEYHLRL